MPKILIVDDEEFFLKILSQSLTSLGYDDQVAVSDPSEVSSYLSAQDFDLALLDVSMPGINGLELVKLVGRQSPQTQCIMVTANEEIPTVIKAVKLGAYDYLLKPVDVKQLGHAVARALEHKRMVDLLLLKQAAKHDLDNPEIFSHIITVDNAMLRLLREAELHARSEIPVLITGETGTGKELIAGSIHRASPRASANFVAVNMLAISPGLFESEFFGHAKGAFTGAISDKEGFLAQARGGTLFLDEIGDLTLEIQGKLLRILQEGEYTPVGKTRAEKADVRFIAATNQDLEDLVEQRRFRKDLYYRLRFAWVDLPPLRERKEDIQLLAAHFLKESLRPKSKLSEQVQAMLLAHDWPGNIRELKAVLEAAANLAVSGNIAPRHLNLPAMARAVSSQPMAICEPLAEVERRHILAAYEQLGHNKTQTAKQLKISLATLQRKLKAFQVK